MELVGGEDDKPHYLCVRETEKKILRLTIHEIWNFTRAPEGVSGQGFLLIRLGPPMVKRQHDESSLWW